MALSALALAVLFLGAAGAGLVDEGVELTPAMTLEGSGLQEPREHPEGSWRFDVAIYLWMADVSGELSIGPLSGSADAGFSDLVDKLSGAFTLHVEGWSRDRIGFFTDFSWMRFRDSRTRDTALGTIEGDAEINLGFIEGAAAARIRQDEVAFDFFMGVRVLYLGTELDLPPLGSQDKQRWLFDPMLGARVLVQPLTWLLLTLRTDVAGFGVGTEMTGNVAGTVGFRFSSAIALLIGYRAMGMHVRDGRQDIDVRMHGPVLAFDVGF